MMAGKEMTGTTKLRGMNRRQVIGGVFTLLGGVAAMAALKRYLRPTPLDGPRAVVVGDAADPRFAPGMATMSKAEGVPVFIRRDSSGAVTALRPTCTHQGCPLKLEADHLACPCHGGKFSLDGTPVQGPPKVPLQTLPAEVRRGKLVVTLGPDDV
jgi:Rieske Fe-S protein